MINCDCWNVPIVRSLPWIFALWLSCRLTFPFVLFQTTKGASAFKICRGIEAVGGSLRSVNTNTQFWQHLCCWSWLWPSFSLCVLESSQKWLFIFLRGEYRWSQVRKLTQDVGVNRKPQCKNGKINTIWTSQQNQTGALLKRSREMMKAYATGKNQWDRKARADHWTEGSNFIIVFLCGCLCVSLQCDFIQGEHDLRGWLLERRHVSFLNQHHCWKLIPFFLDDRSWKHT